MSTRSALINVMVSAVYKASKKLRRDFSEVEQLQVSKKGPADFVSSADRRTEDILISELSHSRPDFGFITEEHGEIKGENPRQTWLIDPIDGTTNFLHGLPHFAMSVALVHDGQIEAGVVYDPIKEELFWAEKGKGAWMNDNRIRVSARRQLPESLLATGLPFLGKGDSDLTTAELKEIMPSCSGVRRFGAASLDLAYVAAGRFDGFWEHGLQPWDIAAGLLLVREAGGYVSTTSGGTNILETGDVLATNGEIQRATEKLLRDAKRSLR